VLEYLHDDGTTALVLLNLMAYLDSEQHVWASYNTLAKNTGLSRSTVMRAVQKLCEFGVLVKTRQSKNGRNAPNSYTVNFNNPKTFVLPGGVTRDTIGVVSPVTPGSSTRDTTSGSTRDTTNKSKEQEEKNKRGRGMSRVDSRLFS
jgi:biotin operon repressor